MGNVETMLLGYAAWSSQDGDEMFHHLSNDVVMEPSGLRDGLAAHVRSYNSWDDVLAAAGVTE